MLSRRDLFGTAAALAAAGALGTAVGGCAADDRYAREARAARAPVDASLRGEAQLRELVRAATLAANGHNTQPWIFALAPDSITLRPDYARRTPAVDPDDHHLWVSLGCATENLVVAAAALGRSTAVELASGQIRVSLGDGATAAPALAQAIVRRQCTRAEFSGTPLAPATLASLADAAARPGVELRLITERARLATVLEYVTEGNSAQMRDPAFVAELRHWIRFDPNQALARRDGLFVGSSGHAAVPAWLAERLFGLFYRERAENDTLAGQLRSSAGVAVFIAARAGPAGWLEVGRAYQRFALAATTLEVRSAFVNQPIEVPAVRDQFGTWLGLPGRRADLVVRFGAGPLLPYSLRRPVADVIDAAASPA